MYRVAIVDDERIVKLAVQSMIEWGGALELELAGTASDGAEALELARRERVDIVVTDLKMAGMDGLELLTELKRLEEPPEVIVLSNFGDFGFVREALKGGALDYILKTDISPESLMACIREAVARLGARGRSGSRPRDRGAFLVEAESGQEGLLAAFRAALRGAGVPRRGALLAFALDSDSDRPADGALRALAPQGLKACASCAISSADGGAVFLMPLFAEDSSFEPGAAASWLADQARLYYGILAGVAWSAPFADEEGLARAFAAVSRAAELFFYSVNAGKALESANRAPPPRSVLDELELALPGPGRPSADPMHDLRAVVARAADLDLPPAFLRAIAARSASYVAAGEGGTRGELALAIESAPTDALLLEAYAAAAVPEGVKSAGPRACRAEVRRVLERLDADLAARVSVPDLAKEAALSESYLCTVFKAQTGKSIVGYVNDRRLDRAADLLRTGRYLVKEAAAEVGFDDPFYFNRLFKRRFGASPSSIIPQG